MKDYTWIHLPDAEISKIATNNDYNDAAFAAISVWDTPTALGIKLDKDGKHLKLKFEYISESESKESIKSKFAQILIGKNSNRVYEFECDLGSLDKQFVTSVQNKGRLKIARELKALKVALNQLRNKIEIIQELSNRTVNANNLNALDNLNNWWERQPSKSEILNHTY